MLLTSYSRKVSNEEARQGYILIEKSRLGFFPPEVTPFSLGSAGRAVVESYGCECRGPAMPHRHWVLRLPGLAAGGRVELVKEGDAYRLRHES